MKIGRCPHRVLGAVVAATVLALTACSSPADTSANSSAGSNASTAGGQAASDVLAGYLDNPTSVGIDTELKQTPERGLSVISVLGGTNAAQRNSAAMQAAATAIGWEYATIDAGTTPTSAASGFQAALARKPDAIVFAGYPASTFSKQIAEAQAAGIAVISSATGDVDGDGVITDVAGDASIRQFAQVAAAYLAANIDENDKVGVVNLQGFPITEAFTDAFVANAEQWCETCALEVIDQQVTDIATKTPSNLVAYLQRHPDVKWLVFGAGSLAQGVSATLKGAGINGVRIIGAVPTEANLDGIGTDSETGWVGYPTDILGWTLIDQLARHFDGSLTQDAGSNTLPSQMLTKGNLATAAIDNGYYVGVADYQEQFKQLWKVD